MPSQYELTAGQWWRFTAYQLVRGVIRPAPNAQLVEYDPWESFYRGRVTGIRATGRYEDLIALVDSLKFKLGDEEGLDLEPVSKSALLSWCSQYGLLGILPHRAFLITLATRWQKSLAGEAHGRLYPTTVQFRRSGATWLSDEVQVFAADGEVHWNTRPELEGKSVAPNEYPKNTRPPGVLLEDLKGEKIADQAFSEEWAKYFPSIPDDERVNYPYPEPLTKEFWQLYAEPLSEFAGAVRLLRNTLDGLRTTPNEHSSTQETQETQEFGSARHHLDALTSSVVPFLSVGESHLELRFSCKSLLATFALMAMLDITGGERLDRCMTCGRFFTSKSPIARYCSSACRQTAQKRAQRERQGLGRGARRVPQS